MNHADRLERMAEAWWNRHATIKWADFMREHPESKSFYLESMDAALAVLNLDSTEMQKRAPGPYSVGDGLGLFRPEWSGQQPQ